MEVRTGRSYLICLCPSGLFYGQTDTGPFLLDKRNFPYRALGTKAFSVVVSQRLFQKFISSPAEAVRTLHRRASRYPQIPIHEALAYRGICISGADLRWHLQNLIYSLTFTRAHLFYDFYQIGIAWSSSGKVRLVGTTGTIFQEEILRAKPPGYSYRLTISFDHAKQLLNYLPDGPVWIKPHRHYVVIKWNSRAIVIHCTDLPFPWDWNEPTGTLLALGHLQIRQRPRANDRLRLEVEPKRMELFSLGRPALRIGSATEGLFLVPHQCTLPRAIANSLSQGNYFVRTFLDHNMFALCLGSDNTNIIAVLPKKDWNVGDR